jgi:hypothetical protein
MRVFKTRHFARFAKHMGIGDTALAKVIRDAESGLIAAHLSTGLVKLRLARSGGGKRGGFRTIVAYRAEKHAVFVFGFAKNERDNIPPDRLAELKTFAQGLSNYSDAQFDAATANGQLQEVPYA